MHEIIPHPEIINPYGLEDKGFKDRAFVEDLNVDQLLDAVPFHTSNVKESRVFAKDCRVDPAWMP